MKLTYLLSLLIITSVSHARSSVSFDRMGNMLSPDTKIIRLGQKANKKGNIEYANKQFQKAAQYGNEEAKILLVNNFIKTQDFTTALAWLKLIDTKQINDPDTVTQSIKTLKRTLTNNYKQVRHCMKN